MKKLLSFILVIMMIAMTTITSFASNYAYSIEDVFKFFETDTLPTWSEIRSIVEEDYSPPEDEDAKIAYKHKRNLSEAIILGFKKSSSYSKFKNIVDKHCTYNNEFMEVLPIGYTEDADVTDKEFSKNEGKLADARRLFDKAMSEASVRVILDTNNTTRSENFITRFLDRLTDVVVGTVHMFVRNIDRLGLAFMSLQLAAELVYLAVDGLRPILGMQGLVHRRKVRLDTEDGVLLSQGRDVYVDDHSRVFRLVGRAARLAVEQEYKISDDMVSAVKNNILWCFLKNKADQILLITASVIIVYTNLWSEVLIWISGGFSFLS